VSRSRSTDAVSSYHGDEERDTSDPESAESGVHMYGDHGYLRCNEATEYVPLAFGSRSKGTSSGTPRSRLTGSRGIRDQSFRWLGFEGDR
jgi:hypothetical protein